MEAQFTSNAEPDQSPTYKTWLLRPVCGCYTCNLCACSETFPFVEEIFPCLRLKKTVVQDGTVQYAVNPKEFVEKVFGVEYTSELGRACPYWRQFVAQCNDQLHVKLTAMGVAKPVERVFAHGHHGAEKDKVSSKKSPIKLSANKVLNALIYYCLCAPRFINYPSSYAPLSQEFPAIILS